MSDLLAECDWHDDTNIDAVDTGVTPTEELRRLLDKHKIAWDYGPAGACDTAFRVNGHELSFVEMRGGVTCATIFTPKQVVMYVREIVREKKYLQSELSRYESWFHWTNLTKKQLEVENAKLRELCADIYEMAYHEYPSAFEATFAGRMRDLGVEVDQ